MRSDVQLKPTWNRLKTWKLEKNEERDRKQTKESEEYETDWKYTLYLVPMLAQREQVACRTAHSEKLKSQ
jgi:hypothetical protein